jgi:hypothetical protein
MHYNTYHNINRKNGFNLIEIILALAVATLTFTAVFNFAVTAHVRNTQSKLLDSYFSHSYGEPYCALRGNIDDVRLSSQSISFASYISTSTRMTSIHPLNDDRFIVTVDSASTTEPDMFMFSISTTTSMIDIISSIDVGPGIQDGKLLGNFLYVANTSVNSHVKSFYVNTQATGTSVFTELSNIRIASLSAGVSNPKKLSIYNNNLILGTEKSNTGPEVFMLPIESDGAVRYVSHTFELSGQLNQSLSAYEHLYIANAADPELRLINKNWQEFFSYDAPLTLGNGKSVLYIYPYTILGRTLGSSELSLLQNSGTTTSVLDMKRTNGTVDYIQDLSGSKFLTITANDTKELQFWHIDGTRLVFDRGINILGRVTAYTCNTNTMYMFVTSNNQTYLIWLNL